MSEAGAGIPPEVRDLLQQREDARAAKDFAAADRFRERIRDAGFEIADGPAGPVLEPRVPEGPRVVRPADAPDRLGEPPTEDASVHWIVEGWPRDVARGIAAFDAHAGSRSIQHIVVDVRGTPEAADAGAVWSRYLAEWTTWNHVRAGTCLLAAALQMAGLLLRP